MTILKDFLPLVKSQISHNEKCLKKYNKNSRGWASCKKRINEFQELHDLMDSYDDTVILHGYKFDNIDKTPRLTLLPSDLEGLPQELLDELAISTSDQADFDIIAVIEDHGGIISLDQLMIGLYRKTGEVSKRPKINSKVYRLAQKGLLKNIEGKKAVYALPDYTAPADEGEDTVDNWFKK